MTHLNSVMTPYTIQQYKRAIALTKNAEPKIIKKNIITIVFNDLVGTSTQIEKLKFIVDKKLKITLASEIINYDALNQQERTLIFLIYKDEFAKSIIEKANINLMDFINPFVNRQLKEDEQKLLNKILPILKEQIPQIAELLSKRISTPTEIEDLFEELANTYSKDAEKLKVLKLIDYLNSDIIAKKLIMRLDIKPKNEKQFSWVKDSGWSNGKFVH